MKGSEQERLRYQSMTTDNPLGGTAAEQGGDEGELVHNARKRDENVKTQVHHGGIT